MRPPPKPPDATGVKDIRQDLPDLDMGRKIEFEEHSPHQEGIISDMYERPDKSYIQEPTGLKDLIDTTKLIQRFLPKQAGIDKILDIIKRKVLKGTHSKKFKLDISLVLILKIYTFTWLRTNCLARKVLYTR